MILSKRERYIVIGAAVAVGIFGLDRFALSPLLAQREQVQTDIAKARTAHSEDREKLARGRRAADRWPELEAAGLKADEQSAEAQILNLIRAWEQESRLEISTIKRERVETDKHFQRLTFRLSGNGSMANVGRFLSKVETAAIPLRITDMQIGSRRDGTDDLSLLMGISTLYLAPEQEKPVRPTAAAGKGATPAAKEAR